MRTNSSSSRTLDQMDPVFVGAGSAPSASRSASIHSPNSPTRSGQHRSARRTRMTPTLQSEVAQLFTEIDGLPVLVRLLVKDMLAVMQSDFSSKEADVHSLLSNTLEKMVDRMRGSSSRRNDRTKQPPATVEMIPGCTPLVSSPAQPNETILRVGTAGARSPGSNCEAWRPPHRPATARIPIAQIHDATEGHVADAGEPLERGMAL